MLSLDLPTQLSVFKFLPLRDLGRASCACRGFRDLAAHPSLWKLHFLTELFPSLKVIDKRAWKAIVDLSKLDIHINDDPFFNERLYMIRVLIPVLKRLFSQLVVKGDAGLTLLTIPKNHTLSTLQSIVRSPKQGNQMDNFGYIYQL